MSFPTERTEILLRFETGQAVGNATLAAVRARASAASSSRSAASRAASRRPSASPPNLKFTWAHAFGYPLEDPKAGGQRPRLKFEKLFHKDKYGTPLPPDPAVDEALEAKGLHPGAGPAAGPHRGDRRAGRAVRP